VALLEDADMDAQLQRTLVGALSGSADLGEALATATRVQAGDYSGWFDEWSAAGDRARSAGDDALAKGHPVTARKAYLRAAEYHRQSYFFLRHDLSDARIASGYRDHFAAFDAAMPLFEFACENVTIAAADVSVRGQLYRPDPDGQRRPTLVFPGGFDGTSQEFWKLGAYAALGRHWNALAFDGPGQGGLLIEDGITMRPDFESVLGPVIDWLVDQAGVDPDRVAVVGRSLGGYFAPRGVAHEPRVAALVCDPGQHDFTSRFNMSDDDLQKLRDHDSDLEASLDGFLDGPRNTEFWGARMAAMGAKTFADFLRIAMAFTLDGHAEHIACPTLITEGEGDFASQSQVLYDALTCPKQLHRFSAAEGAGGHCEGLGLALWEAAAFDWLSEQLER
jgi:hypothetical protein